MKTFTASHLSHKPAEVLAEALLNPVVIQRKNTNGDVMAEYVLMKKDYKEDDFYNRIGQVAVELKNAKGDALDTSV